MISIIIPTTGERDSLHRAIASAKGADVLVVVTRLRPPLSAMHEGFT